MTPAPDLHLAELNVGRLLAPTDVARLVAVGPLRDQAFGWRHLKEAKLWPERNCTGVAAE